MMSILDSGPDAAVGNARARKACGRPDSFSTFPGKVLLFTREIQPGRVKLIFVEEAGGF